MQNNSYSSVSQPDFGTKRILAIDDVPDVLSTIKAVLQDSYTVFGVTNGMSAMKFLANNTADLILLDIEMPDMDGFTLLRIIRQMENYKKTPVVFLTGNASVEYIRTAIENGGNDFVKKPFEVHVLKEKIRKLIGG